MEGHWSVMVLVFTACLGPPMCSNAVTVTTIERKSTVEGATVQLSCTYLPHTTPEDFGYLAWSKDGTTFLTYACEQSCGLQESTSTPMDKYDLNVDTSSSGNLTIFDVDLDDEATYMCSVLTSDLVVYSSTTQLTVDVLIQDIVVSDYRTAYTNNSVVQIQVEQSYQFRCSLVLPTKPRVEIVWEGQQIDFTMDDQVDEPSRDNSGLVMSHRVVHVTAGMQDSGKALSCVATHPTTGQTVVSRVVLDVQACPSSVMVHECPTSVISGDSATLRCRSAATSPPPVLYWLYDSVRVQNSTSTIAEDGANVLSHTKLFDRVDFNREFKCCIESTAMCNQLCSESCRPDILYPVSNVAVHSSVPIDRVIEGTRDLEVNCTANGNPMGSSFIGWTRIDADGNVAGPQRESPMKFTVVSRSDAGRYRCTVDNGVGSSRFETVKIIVYHPPIITNEGYRAHRNEGEAVSLTCNATANPRPTITWYTPDNRTISGPPSAVETTTEQSDYSINISSRLDIVNIVPAVHYGIYRCVAENDYGRVEISVTLGGKSKPAPPTAVSFIQKTTTQTSLDIIWRPGHDGGADQTYTVTSCLVGANEKCTVHRGITDTHFNITALQAYSLYDVTVTGVNVFGESEASKPARNSTAPLSPDQLGVVATFDITSGYIIVKRKSNNTRPIPKDLCFDLEVKVIVARREEACLKLNNPVKVETVVSQSQIWLLSCGRGVCSEGDHVMFPAPPLESKSPETNDLDITSLVAIVAGAVVCLVVILIVFAAWKWNKKRGPMLHKQMSSRKLPTLPRGNSCGPPSPSCQEAMESQVYDGLELGSVNQYMHPYAQSTIPANKHCKAPSNCPPDSDLQYGDLKTDDIPPPSGDKVKQNHIEGTYTTTLSYLPMGSPTVLKKTERKPSSPVDRMTSEPAFTSVGKNNGEPENADVQTALLVDIGDERRSPSDSDDGYYSVPKNSRVASIDETTPALGVY
ncbi:roundabout homolog 1-like [Lytechinus variegatus]|uniref:roundabout homolog 1-like n=1 Tax=Lytechinus variegatus TaxID=7654 RepID=UPI001BB2041F|nr:roundabout homolog 1-like [Lytechinus variegatus]